jgi:hypothetical protein
MVDSTQGAPESETPVNPYSLLEAVNRSSDKAQTGWLIFLAIMAYVMVAVAGVTHEALLLETVCPNRNRSVPSRYISAACPSGEEDAGI